VFLFFGKLDTCGGESVKKTPLPKPESRANPITIEKKTWENFQKAVKG